MVSFRVKHANLIWKMTKVVQSWCKLDIWIQQCKLFIIVIYQLLERSNCSPDATGDVNKNVIFESLIKFSQCSSPWFIFSPIIYGKSSIKGFVSMAVIGKVFGFSNDFISIICGLGPPQGQSPPCLGWTYPGAKSSFLPTRALLWLPVLQSTQWHLMQVHRHP